MVKKCHTNPYTPDILGVVLMTYLFHLSFDLFQIWQQINGYQNTPLGDKSK